MGIEQYQRGDVVWVKKRLAGQSVNRHAVVLTESEYHQQMGEVLIAPIVNSAGEWQAQWLQRLADWEVTGSERPGWVLCMPRTVNATELAGKAGELSNRDREGLEVMVVKAFANVPELRRSQAESEAATKEEKPGWTAEEYEMKLLGTALWKQRALGSKTWTKEETEAYWRWQGVKKTE